MTPHKRWNSCQISEEGNLIAWSSVEFINTSDAIKNADHNFCANLKRYFVFKHLKTFSQSQEWCEIIGGEIASPDTTDDLNRIISTFNKKVYACQDGFFIGNTDINIEGKKSKNRKQSCYQNSLIIGGQTS